MSTLIWSVGESRSQSYQISEEPFPAASQLCLAPLGDVGGQTGFLGATGVTDIATNSLQTDLIE